jgi:predicted tellurium resistance membrane protein TerC
MLMDRYPIIVYLGAMVLGKVAGEMMITDPYVQSILQTGKVTQYIVEGAFAVGVVAIGKLWLRMKIRRELRGQREERAQEALKEMDMEEEESPGMLNH